MYATKCLNKMKKIHYHGQVCSTTDVRRSLINRTEPLEKNNDEKIKN